MYFLVVLILISIPPPSFGNEIELNTHLQKITNKFKMWRCILGCEIYTTIFLFFLGKWKWLQTILKIGKFVKLLLQLHGNHPFYEKTKVFSRTKNERGFEFYVTYIQTGISGSGILVVCSHARFCVSVLWSLWLIIFAIHNLCRNK